MNDFPARVEALFHDWRYATPKTIYGLVRTLRPLICIEVGTYRGYTAAWIAQALRENGQGHLYCIDNFSLTDHTARYGDAKRHLLDNLSQLGLDDLVTLREGDSLSPQVWPEKCDFAYVDGWHSYKHALNDFQNCAVLGAECICFDDAEQSVGPRLVVHEIRASGHWDVINISRDCGMAVCMRKHPLHPITFSQEEAGHLGRDLQQMTKTEQLGHLQTEARRAKENQFRINYDPIVPFLHPGK